MTFIRYFGLVFRFYTNNNLLMNELNMHEIYIHQTLNSLKQLNIHLYFFTTLTFLKVYITEAENTR